MIEEDGLELLTEEQSMQLLASQSLGRVGVSVGALPAIFPVNYVLVEGDIFFRTGEGLKSKAALHRSVLAFEVDDSDYASRTGWSVLVVGLAEEVSPERGSELPDPPTPWASGERRHLIRIHPEFVSGRRINPHVGPRDHWALGDSPVRANNGIR
jgi:hypothetical protein